MILNYTIWETADSIQQDHWAQTVQVVLWIIWFFLPLPGDWQVSTLPFSLYLFLSFSLFFFSSFFFSFFPLFVLKRTQL